jgi:hypothetical protein
VTGVKKTELDTALGYFENNARRMPYHWFRSPAGCSSAPESLNPAAKRLSASA